MDLEVIWQGWRTCDTGEDFLGKRHSLLSEFLPDQPYYIMSNIKNIVYRYDYHYYQITLRVNIFMQTRSGEKLLKQAS
jgi:hypothetical protein